jgi:branched-chain amino acid transport system substrate-binding protein
MTRRSVLAAAAALALAGCASDRDIAGGGKVSGGTLTVYSSLPRPGEGAARDMVDGEKLALAQARGRAGDFGVNFASIDEAPGPDEETADAAAAAAEDAIRDPAVIAVIGALGSQTAMTMIPLLNSAGILHVSPGAGYPGFTRAVEPNEPEGWYPSGRRNFARIVGDDLVQARALVAAAAAAADGERPRVAVEAEPGRDADALAEAVRAAGLRPAGDPTRADAVIYVGEDPVNAAGVADALAREAPDTPVVLPEALTRAGIADELSAAARRNAVLVSAAPEPGSTPELRAFEQDFRARFGRAPGPYAAVGYEAMRQVLAAIERAGPEAARRRTVIEAFFAAGPQTGTVLGDYRITPAGELLPGEFTAFLADNGRYLDL